MLEKDQSIWLVHLGYEPPLPLQFKRVELGAVITGGKTGTHRTGHGETYWGKFVELVKLGFMPVEVAKEIGVLASAWSPPESETLDAKIQRGEYRLKLAVS